MTWAEVTSRVRQLLDKEDNKDIAQGAVDDLTRLLRMNMPEVIASPDMILGFDQAVVVEKLGIDKGLNTKDRRVLDAVYQALSQDDEMPLPQTMPKTKLRVPKLKALADCLSKIFEQSFNCTVSYAFETQLAWLLSVPDRAVYDRVWADVSAVYGALVDNRWTLNERLQDYAEEIKGGRQRVDIWFDAPLNCMVEFDETQHFNQFRLKTLQAWNGYTQCSFDTDQYLALAKATTIPAGTTGFQRLKSFDPLFPPLLAGDAQDNRIRQRAFRDFLKDITPLVMPQVNPTIRISYMVTHGRIRDFIAADLEAVETYLRCQGILEQMRLQ